MTDFFTNQHKNVFVLLNMPEVLKGALFSRYSRSAKPLRQLFTEEYLNNSEIEKDQFLITEKAEKFYSRWLAEYGDDSIAELGGVHVGIENISVLATKSIEDRRIGLSPLEKSTRYVRFDDKVNGKYRYYVDPKIANSRYGKTYESTMDLLFDTYSELIAPMTEYFIKRFPKPQDVSDKAYESSIRAKACDTLRGLLPFSTQTNMGVFGNGRALEYMLTRMFSNDLSEVLYFANDIYEELKKIIPNFVERVKSEKGDAYVNYLKITEVDLYDQTKTFRKQKTKDLIVGAYLLDYDKKALDKLVASIIFTHSDMAFLDIAKAVSKMKKAKKLELLNSCFTYRKGRWNKIMRAFEDPYYNFEIISDAGAYKDLQRHRVLTQERQLFTCRLGYDIPQEIIDAGLSKRYKKAMDAASLAYEKISKDFPIEAQYVVTHGYKVRYRMKMNLREAFHFCELRSSPQGHPNYRIIAQEVYKRIKEVHPYFAEAMKYVNMEKAGLERLSAEVRKEEKLKKLHS